MLCLTLLSAEFSIVKERVPFIISGRKRDRGERYTSEWGLSNGLGNVTLFLPAVKRSNKAGQNMKEGKMNYQRLM